MASESFAGLAEGIIAAADRERRADELLRQTIKRQRGFLPEDAAALSRAVFSFFRWRGWTDEQAPMAARLQRTGELAERFARTPESFSDEELISRAVPGWLRDEMEISPAWVRALQTEPRLWLRARRGQGKQLANSLGQCSLFGEGFLSDVLEYKGRQDLFRTAAFHQGEFELQDLSSQAVGLVCAPRAGETWWDACAGEGGKLLHLSSLMENKGLVWASDRSASRLGVLKRRAARAKVFNYRVAAWNGGPKLPTRTRFDGVLVDAPCSGTGTWQRNPHARWTTLPQDVKELSSLQASLLANAAAGVKAGGKVIYAVCTLTRAETAAVADGFEARFPEFAPLAFANPLRSGGAEAARLTLWPQEFGGNGMFIAAWQRKQTP